MNLVTLIKRLYLLLLLFLPFTYRFEIVAERWNVMVPTEPLCGLIIILFLLGVIIGKIKLSLDKRVFIPIAFLLVGLIISFFAFDQLSSFKYLLVISSYCFVGLIVPMHLSFGREEIFSLLKIFVFGGVVLGFYILYKHFFVDGVNYRASYFVGQPIYEHSHTNLSVVFETLLLASLYLMFSLSKSRWVWGITSVTFGIVIILSFSRASWMFDSVVFGALFVFLKNKLRIQLASILGTALIIGFLIIQIYPSSWGKHREKDLRVDKNDESTHLTLTNNHSHSDRLCRWLTGVDLWKQNKLTGIGLGNFPDTFSDLLEQGKVNKKYQPMTFKMNIHNLYLSWMVEGGVFFFLIGILGSLLMLIQAFKVLIDKNRSLISLLAVIAVGLFLMHGFFQDFLNESRVVIFFWMAVGLVFMKQKSSIKT